MSRLNYNHLHYFYTIAQAGSIAEAARKLFITPQTLSAQLSALEHQLGKPLFDRKGKRLVLNEVGHLAYEQAKEIFSRGEDLLFSVKHFDSEFSDKLTLGITDIVAKALSYQLVKSIYDVNNKVKVICKETHLDGLLSDLALKKVDAIISDTPLSEKSPINASNHLIGQCGLSFFAAPELAAQVRDNFPESLNGRNLFIGGENTNQRYTMLNWLEKNALSPRILGEFDDSALVKYFGQAGYGVFCGPCIFDKHLIAQFNVEKIGQTNDIIEHFYLITLSNRIEHPALSHMLKFGRSLF